MKLLGIIERITTPRNRQNVLIFGASGGGHAQFDRIKRTHNVIGFIDNSVSKQGGSFLSRPVYSPADAVRLTFDRIVIASCYHAEIRRQLVEGIGIAPERISGLLVGNNSRLRVRAKLRQALSRSYFRTVLGLKHRSAAEFGVRVAGWFNDTYRSLKLLSVRWADEQDEWVVSTLAPEATVTVHGPAWVGRAQERYTVTRPAICLSRYRAATINCSSNSVVQGDMILMSRVPDSERCHADYSDAHVVAHGERLALVRAVTPVEVERGIAITGSADMNYYHWMIEVVSKLAYLDRLDERYTKYPLLISEKALEIEAISRFIDHLNVDRDIIYLRSDERYQVKDLLTITPPNFLVPNFWIGLADRSRDAAADHYFDTASLQFIRRTALSYLASKGLRKRVSRKIFLARKGILRPYNQDEVWEVLKRDGFEAVHLEDLSFAEQLLTLQEAEALVGPTGAAWTNLLFCEPGTKALCWMAEEYGDNPCYSNLAAEMQVDMSYLRYKTRSICSAELYFGPYTISVAGVEQWLSSIR